MKPLKKWAALCAALCAAVSCSAAPPSGGEDPVEAPPRQTALDEARSQLGDLAGFTGYSRKIENTLTNADNSILKSSSVMEVYLGKDLGQIKTAASIVYNGKWELKDTAGAITNTFTLNNEAAKISTEYGAKEISVPADYTFVTLKDSARIPLDPLDLGTGYKFIEQTATAAKVWEFKKMGGDETWKTDPYHVVGIKILYYMRIADNKLYLIGAAIDAGSKTVLLITNPKDAKDGDDVTHTQI